MYTNKERKEEYAGMAASLLTERTTQSYCETKDRYLSLLINGAANSIIAMSSKRIANGDETNSENMTNEGVMKIGQFFYY